MSRKGKKFQFNSPAKNLIRRLFRDYLRHHVGKIVVGVSCMILVALATGTQAKLIQPALDKVLVEGDDSLILILPLAFLCVSVLKGFASYGQAVMMQKLGLRVNVMMQNEMFGRLIDADMKYLHDDSTGKLISRFLNDVNYTRDATVKTFTGFGRDLLTILVLGGVMVHTNWQMAAIALVILPISVFPILYIGRRIRRLSENTQVSLGDLTGFLDEVFKGFRQVKAYGMEDYERERASTVFERVYALQFKAGRTRSRSYPIMESLAGVAIALVLGWGGFQVSQGETTIGQFMTFFVAMAAAYQPLRSLANLNANLQHGLAALERVFAVIDYRPDIADSDDAKPLEITNGHVQLADVHFSYDEKKIALHGVTVDVPAGQNRRAGRAVRRREVDDPQPDPALLRPQIRHRKNRRTGCPRHVAGVAAGKHRAGQPGSDVVQRHGTRQHSLWPAGRQRGSGDRRRKGRRRTRFHRTAARWLRHGRRRARHARVGRPTATVGDRPGDAAERADPAFG